MGKIDIDNLKSEMEVLQNKYDDLVKLKESNERKAELEAAIVEKKQAAEKGVEKSKIIQEDKKVNVEKRAANNGAGKKDKLDKVVEPDGDNIVLQNDKEKEIQENVVEKS